jgi:DNA ligase-1
MNFPPITLIKPMKAHKYNPVKVVRPGFLQPKLNGLRALWNGVTLNSYNLEEWHPSVLHHITTALYDLGLSDILVDGELYTHGQSLQWINSRASINRKRTHKESHLVQFHIFDVVSTSPFKDRVNILKHIERALMNNPDLPIRVCPTYEFTSEHDENTIFKLCRKEGYEGMIYRQPDEEYGRLANCGNKENRWWKLMKRKFWEDMDAEIVECIEGKGKFTGSLGAFRCEGENGSTFQVGTGEALTHEMRQQYWNRRESLIGKKCKVVYEMLSDSKVPLKPVVEVVYE